jgi:hypothetical protein
MILMTMVLLATQAPPTLGALANLSPGAAGEIVLAGKDHEPVAKIVAPAGRGMDPPGMVERQLVERPVAGPQGCSRRRWIARFSHTPGVAEDEATLSSVWASTEVALPGAAGCPDDGYVHLNPGLGASQALPALRYLDDIRLGDAPAEFTCSDETASGLCADPGKIRQALAKLSPWAVTRQNGQMVFWLGTPGQAVTEVRYSPNRLDQVTVSRRIPAPF